MNTSAVVNIIKLMKQLTDEEYSKMPKWSINKHHLCLCDIYNRDSTITITNVISELFLNYLNIDKAAYAILE